MVENERKGITIDLDPDEFGPRKEPEKEGLSQQEASVGQGDWGVIARPQPLSQQAAPPPPLEGQINIRAPMRVIERFKAICREDRRTYADMLEILMDRSD